ncbi:hypothetical protein WISP_114459 [Willisornis vidua]|uniref:Uncharacterized protein n=1 Tax=Willisornis vidua TaxID=1566151 RepID=A0ABQ9CZM2_9PASS|nr:hypothetical protein WISP_114459 [Willisornis vidua]
MSGTAAEGGAGRALWYPEGGTPGIREGEKTFRVIPCVLHCRLCTNHVPKCHIGTSFKRLRGGDSTAALGNLCLTALLVGKCPVMCSLNRTRQNPRLFAPILSLTTREKRP